MIELSFSVRNSSFIAVRTQLDADSVSDRNFDIMETHFTGQVAQYLAAVVQFDPESCIRQGLRYYSFNFGFFFRQRLYRKQ